MLSRVAESLYWMCRYVERAENVARFISVNFNLMFDVPGGSKEQWLPLVVTTGDAELFEGRYGEPTRENVLEFLSFDTANPNSILSCMTAARENARSVREVISSEMWEHINRFYMIVRDSDKKHPTLESMNDYYEQIRRAGQQFIGVTDATMTHNQGWHLCRLGRLIERADKTSRILDVKYFMLLPSPEHVGTTFDDIQWSALLHSASAFEMYRQRHGVFTPANVVDFLLLDREFPRAVLFCLTKANDSLHAITGRATGQFGNNAEQRLGRLQSELAYFRPEEIIARGVHEFVNSLQIRLNAVSDAIYKDFFELRPLTTV